MRAKPVHSNQAESRPNVQEQRTGQADIIRARGHVRMQELEHPWEARRGGLRRQSTNQVPQFGSFPGGIIRSHVTHQLGSAYMPHMARPRPRPPMVATLQGQYQFMEQAHMNTHVELPRESIIIFFISHLLSHLVLMLLRAGIA